MYAASCAKVEREGVLGSEPSAIAAMNASCRTRLRDQPAIAAQATVLNGSAAVSGHRP